MIQRQANKQLAAILFGSLMSFLPSSLRAQVVRAPLTDGFVQTSSIEMSVDEMLGPRKPREASEAILGPGYPALWIAEIQYKPVRLIRIPVTDPKTKRTETEWVWYMMYRMIPRDYTELAAKGREELIRKLSDPEHDPENVQDAARAPSLMLPRFLLRTDDKGAVQEYQDELNPRIQDAIFRREMGRKGENRKLHNSVEAIASVGTPVPADDPNALDQAVYGVAIWRNVDLKTDFFTVFMSGLTNAYRVRTGENGEQIVEEKVAVQKFSRPGDEFKPTEKEFQVSSEAEWTYRAVTAELEVPEIETILRNAKNSSADSAEKQ